MYWVVTNLTVEIFFFKVILIENHKTSVKIFTNIKIIQSNSLKYKIINKYYFVQIKSANINFYKNKCNIVISSHQTQHRKIVLQSNRDQKVMKSVTKYLTENIIDLINQTSSHPSTTTLNVKILFGVVQLKLINGG